jgi:hypothetical protein
MTIPDNYEPEERLLPILELDELIEIFEYTNERAARRAMRLGIFPVPTFQLAGRTVAHADAVALYMQEMRKVSMHWLEDKYGITEDLS